MVRVARVQALITAATGVATEAAAHHGIADRGVADRLAPLLTDTEAAWTRLAKRWGELVSRASRSDPVLIRAAGEARAAIAQAVCTPTGWATPDQIVRRVDLPSSLTAFAARHGRGC